MNLSMGAAGLAAALAMLLFLLSLRPRRGSAFAAMGGVAVLALAAVYTVDILNLPHMAATGLIGLACGFLAVRDMPPARAGRALAAAAGGVGLSACALAVAAWLNPFAFGLVGADADRLSDRGVLLVGVTVAMGGLASLSAAVALLPRGRPSMMPVAASLAGWAVSGSAFLLDNPGVAAAGGIAGSAALVLAARRVIDLGWKGLADQGPHP